MVAGRKGVDQDTTANPIGFLHRQYLNYCCTNTQGLFSKFPELNFCFKSDQWDITAVTETWFAADIPDYELSIPGMSLLRCDRPTRGGGFLL
ncbi:unnamed protein product [Echinostoma caproni]|uniref:Uncharacterized protein n=1 Tax=Echinostoma caproni TaxID=27848 RepID=A0A183BBK9_9TREM|nr:unnamed protein product [Echinostoma caproni]